MEAIASIGLLVGCFWAAAGLVGYSGVSWKPGVILAVPCALWLVGREGVQPEIIEGIAFVVFLLLLFARQWMSPKKQRRD